MNVNQGVMRALARLLDDDKGKQQKALLNAAPPLRLGTAFLCILLCALAKNMMYVWLVIGFEIVRLAMMNPEAMKRVIRNLILPVLFTAIILIPSVFMGSPTTLVRVTCRVAESVLVLSILNELVSWKEITAAFRFYRVPGLFILVLDMTIRFLILLGRYSNALSEAVAMRSVGERSWKDSHIGGILGTTFLKAQRMAVETSEAMECRCFAGEYNTVTKHHYTWHDAVYLCLPVILIILFVILERAL